MLTARFRVLRLMSVVNCCNIQITYRCCTVSWCHQLTGVSDSQLWKCAQVGPVWDGSSEEAKAEWQSKVDNADVLIMDELAVRYLGDKIAGKKVIALQHDAAASMRTCDSGL